MKASEAAARRMARTAFILRILAAVAIHWFTTLGFFAPDEITYDSRANSLANYWRGTTSVDPTPSFRVESKGFYYIVAALYLPFGQISILPKLINAWIGSRAVLELFRVTVLVGGSEAAGLRAARFMTFFPSQILWSSLLIRDVWVQWLLLRLAREMAELKGRFIPTRIVSAMVLIYGLTQFR